jgi:Arc/MetJ family transcription regulator
MENSYWETLYSKNAIMIDPKLAQQTQQEKDNESKRLAYKYVMSDARPQDFATREELAIIFGRFIQQFHPDKK